MITDRQVLYWILSKRRGLSSRAMLAAALAAQGNAELAGLVGAGAREYRPHDADDFGHCQELLKEIPEVAEHWDAIAAISPEWGRLAIAWPDLWAPYMSGAWKELDHRIRQITRGW